MSADVLIIVTIPCREQRDLLMKCAATALSSKLVARQKNFFSKMVVDAVLSLDELLPLNMIGIKKVQGGSLTVSAGHRLAAVRGPGRLPHSKC